MLWRGILVDDRLRVSIMPEIANEQALKRVMSGTEFDALPFEEGRRWELLDGALVPVASPTYEHQRISMQIAMELKQYLGKKGKVAWDVEFALAGNTRLRPDVWLVHAKKAAELDWKVVPVNGAPDLAVEVISPTESAKDSSGKVTAYLTHGVREVWQVYPEASEIRVYSLPVSAKPRIIAGDGVLTSAILPGFSCPVSRLTAEID